MRLSRIHTESQAHLHRSSHFSKFLLFRSTASRLRTYSTANSQGPEKPEEQENGAKVSEGSSIAKGKASPGKPAAGFEQLYSHAGPMSSPIPGTKEGKPSAPPEFQASPTEQKELDDLYDLMRPGLPSKQQKLAKEAFEDMKRYGVPPEIKEIMEIQKNGVLDLATVAKLVIITTKFVRQVA